MSDKNRIVEKLPGSKTRIWFLKGHERFDTALERIDKIRFSVGDVDRAYLESVEKWMRSHGSISGKQSSAVSAIYSKVRS